jgi:hypothetical protein
MLTKILLTFTMEQVAIIEQRIIRTINEALQFLKGKTCFIFRFIFLIKILSTIGFYIKLLTPKYKYLKSIIKKRFVALFRIIELIYGT